MGGRPDEPGMGPASPVSHAERISMPSLLSPRVWHTYTKYRRRPTDSPLALMVHSQILQGLADCVQNSQGIVAAIEGKGKPDRVWYGKYDREGHDFARADWKKSALEEEARWYGWGLKTKHDQAV
ncbi:hypothetical protein PAXRUDRAFT_827092 [Paxillus rubicundulus Ve08.2h10]|uniref:Uncharacterized protein n=1 Tax=Paxillus rubicundulus Ve08.2h10 TaxID=930991 RepID=A0A0D0DYN0_9AGAM|nr:hypothetical protein PAXRUDRAFT_827092 [Paxillus rubicundulus Ve08.2h10]